MLHCLCLVCSAVCTLVFCGMLQVLQKTVDQQLGLYSDVKEQSFLIAQVMVMSLMSQPVADEIGMHFFSWQNSVVNEKV